MRINSFRSGFLELLSSCEAHILYFDDFHSTSLSLTPSQSVQKSPKWDMKCCNRHLISQTHTSISPLCLLYSCKTKNLLCQKRNSNSLSLLDLFAFLNSLEKQAVSPGSINQRVGVEIALLFLCVCL